MDVLTVSSPEELKSYLASVPKPMLFRGQTRHFGGTHSPAITSSFDRHGCIPNQMLRWSYYAHGALKFALGKAVKSIETSQAVLQHYGWRSFFLDASSSAHVGAWFAAHTYRQKIAVHLSEDCFENPMLLRKPEADYILEEGTGHLYLIDLEVARSVVGVHDLSSIEIKDGRPRFLAQAAWLLGPRKGSLPLECFHSRIIAPRHIFASLAAEGGLESTHSLFPGADEDIVLSSLLHLPWKEIEIAEDAEHQDFSIPAFVRTVEIPEYSNGFSKRYGPENAFYRGMMLGDAEPRNGDMPPLTFREVPEIVAFGTANPIADRFPELMKLLQSERAFAFETKQLGRELINGISKAALI